MGSPPSNALTDSYAVTAEFYDTLHAAAYRLRALRQLTGPAVAARLGILEVGAGTGIGTIVLGAASTVALHAVEPARTMRAQLLARLADIPAEQRERTTVHACAVQHLDLHEFADLAVCINVVPNWDTSQRRAAWQAIAVALVPGGTLVVDCPLDPASFGEGNVTLPAVRVGMDDYECRETVEECAPNRMRQTFVYRVSRRGVLLREEREVFNLWLLDRASLFEELSEVGLHAGTDIHQSEEHLTFTRCP